MQSPIRLPTLLQRPTLTRALFILKAQDCCAPFRRPILEAELKCATRTISAGLCCLTYMLLHQHRGLIGEADNSNGLVKQLCARHA